jgi:ankyrin repeat protein
VKLLLDRGADPDALDTFYKNTAMGWAAYKGHAEVVRVLLERTKRGVGSPLLGGVFAGKPEVVDVVLATGRVTPRDLSYVLEAAERTQNKDIVERLRKAGAVPPPKPDAVVDPATLARYAGRYREAEGTEEFTLAVADGALSAKFGERAFKLGAIDDRRFQNMEAVGVTYEIRLDGERVVGATAVEIGGETRYIRVEDPKP